MGKGSIEMQEGCSFRKQARCSEEAFSIFLSVELNNNGLWLCNETLLCVFMSPAVMSPAG